MIEQEQEKLMTSKDVREWLNISEATLTRMLNMGEIPAYRIRGEWRLSRKDVIDYLASARNTKKQEQK